MRRPLVSVIIVVYNNLNDLDGCFSSILKSDYPNVEIIAVDNASTDGSPDYIRKEFPSVKLMEYPTNVGFTEASNRAFRLSKGKYTLLLNPDTQIPRDTISILVDRMERGPQ
ncbi:MAG: glycosyltransferase family 2 protein, partial [Candidatus Hydrothermarchaeaceae archaeon]